MLPKPDKIKTKQEILKMMDKLLLVNKPMIFDEDEVLQKKLEYWKYIKKNADLCIKTIEEDMPKSRVIQVARFLNDKNKGGTNKC